MYKKAFVGGLLSLTLALPAMADVTWEEEMKMSGMMKMFGGGSQKTITQISGGKMRVESEHQIQIIDLEVEQIIKLDTKKKTYSVMTFEEMRAQMKAAMGKAQQSTEKTKREGTADVSAETLSKTTLGTWRAGTPVNLERALKLGDELGGHLVSGHVDGLAEVVERRPEGDSQRFTFAAPASLAPFIAPKGSVALDGVSLTVNEVSDEPAESAENGGGCRFGINIVPHTAAVTSFGGLQAGAAVNLEIVLVARYLQRLMQKRA